MIYLSGVATGIWQRAREYGIGLMATEHMDWHKIPSFPCWAADSGCYANPDEFDVERYLAWLEKVAPYWRSCLFVTAPDYPGDAEETLDRFNHTIYELRHFPFPVAFVAQDGIDDTEVPWHLFDVLFLGGTTRFKLGGSERITREALRQGKPVHMGRVNSYRRLVSARQRGCASADGTFLARSPDFNVGRMLRWLELLALQPDLPLEVR